MKLLVPAILCLASSAYAQSQETDKKKDDTGVYEKDVVEVKTPKKPITTVTIDNQLGNVEIDGRDDGGKGLVIYAIKHGPDNDALDQLRVSLVPDPDGPMRISTAVVRGQEKTTLPEDQVRIDLVISAPRDAKIDAKVGRGELVVRNMDAGSDLDAGAGTITVENVQGTVYARSVDGNQTFEQVFGDLDASALEADLALDTIHGNDLLASVHDGTIQATHISSKRVELRTTRGKIQLDGDLQLGGSLVVASRSGDVDVRLKSAGKLMVKALAGGKVSFDGLEAQTGDDAGDWVRGRYGKGKRTAAVSLRSKFGDVKFAVVDP